MAMLTVALRRQHLGNVANDLDGTRRPREIGKLSYEAVCVCETTSTSEADPKTMLDEATISHLVLRDVLQI